jgi:hypothetical protein
MRAFRFLQLGLLATLLASSAVLYAQDDKPQEDKPAKQEEAKPAQPRQNEARPAAKQEDMRAPKQDEAKPAGKQDDMKAPKQEEAKPATEPARPDHPEARQEARPENARQDNARPEPARQEAARPDNAHPAAEHGRIPDDRFRANFGREHSFHPPHPEVVSGRPQFQYGGYSFVMVDAWPADWAYTDDCYIDYIDGEYFLFDLRHPGVRIALTIM